MLAEQVEAKPPGSAQTPVASIALTLSIAKRFKSSLTTTLRAHDSQI